MHFIRAIRLRHWTKNLLIFAPAIFAFSFTYNTLSASAITFVLFCFLSSGFYLLNDFWDLDEDRKHPVKSKRPLASGKMNVQMTLVFATLFIVGALFSGYIFNTKVFITMVLYGILQLLYNAVLKNTPILDVMAISGGFLLRILAGFMATDLYFSKWLVLCGGLGSMLIAIDKRKAEFLRKKDHADTRKVLKHYSEELLNTMQIAMITSCIICYSLWSSGPQLNGATTQFMMLTIPFVLYGLFRYKFLGNYHRDESFEKTTKENPEEILLKDKGVMLTIIGWLVSVLVINYLKLRGIIS